MRRQGTLVPGPTAATFAAAALAAATLAAAAGGASEADDPLWTRAVAIAEASRAWRPSRTVARTEHLARDGRVQSVEEVTLAHPPGTDGETQPELVRFVRDGVDVTAQERAKLARKRNEQRPRDRGAERRGSLTVGGTPFDPEAQSRISFRRTSEKRTIGGRDCQGFAYSRTDTEGKTLVGTAFLDTVTGAPLSLRERPDPLPRFADRVWVTTTFAYKGPDEWYPTRVEIEGSGGFLLIKKSLRTTIELLDYRRVEPKGGGGDRP